MIDPMLFEHSGNDLTGMAAQCSCTSCLPQCWPRMAWSSLTIGQIPV